MSPRPEELGPLGCFILDLAGARAGGGLDCKKRNAYRCGEECQIQIEHNESISTWLRLHYHSSPILLPRRLSGKPDPNDVPVELFGRAALLHSALRYAVQKTTTGERNESHEPQFASTQNAKKPCKTQGNARHCIE